MERWKFTITATVLVLLLFIFVRPDKVDSDKRHEATEQPKEDLTPISALDSQIRSRPLSEGSIESIESNVVVTATWGALRKQAPIQLPGGGTARIGLEATSAAASSGILIYCLVDGSDKESRRSITGLQLGPLDVQIHRPGREELLEKALVDTESLLYEDGEQLYVQTISINRAGQYRVKLSLPDEDSDQSEMVAEFTVTGRSDSFHSWFPFRSPTLPVQKNEEDRPQGVRRANLAVTDLERGAAVPSYDGMMPIAYSVDASPRAVDDEKTLPKLFPEAVDPRLQLQETATGFSLESERPFQVDNPDSHLLARWWVNGEPYSPNPQKAQTDWAIEQAQESSGQAESDTLRLEVALEFDPSSIGAQAGDRIGLQLLYLHDGWKHVGESEPAEAMNMLALEEEDPPVPRLSNRIEFRAK